MEATASQHDKQADQLQREREREREREKGGGKRARAWPRLLPHFTHINSSTIDLTIPFINPL